MTTRYDTIITDGQIVTSRAVNRATIAIQQGKIAAILPPTARPDAAQTIKADGLHILPGIIDTHVHLRDPGGPAREDFISGTSAAAAGGITTMLEMPISEPPVNSAQILAERSRLVQPRALVDFGLYAAISAENLGEAQAMAKAGAVAFKTFLTAAPTGREAEFVGLCCPRNGDLPAVMSATAKIGLLHCFHCEDNSLLSFYQDQTVASGQKDGLAHATSRPPIVEDVSVATILSLAAAIGGRVQIVHISSPRATQLVKEARARQVPVTVETCPQYLFLTIDALAQHGPFAKCNPALRTVAERDALWAYLLDGTIDVIGSDHSPYRPAEKEVGAADIFKAPAGMPGLESMLPLMLTAVNQGKLTLPQLVQRMSTRAADLFRLPGKGRIAIGCDADLTLVDMQATWTFDRQHCFSKAKETMRAYHGYSLQGQVTSTWVRGTKIYDTGQIVAEPGYGHFVKPA